MRICIIPARGGSKRIPKKNIKLFSGKPIIGWSIETAISSQLFDHVIVSTDCEKIAEVAQSYGAEVPFWRPKELADDYTVTMPVLKHAIEEMERLKGCVISQVCCLYPTAPFTTPEDLKRGFEVLNAKEEVEVAFSVTTFPFPIQRAIYLREGRVSMVQPEHELTRSQDLEECYHDAGQFYCLSRSVAFEYMGFFSPYAKGVILPRKRVQDVDTLEDWEMAESLFRAQS